MKNKTIIRVREKVYDGAIIIVKAILILIYIAGAPFWSFVALVNWFFSEDSLKDEFGEFTGIIREIINEK